MCEIDKGRECKKWALSISYISEINVCVDNDA